MEGLSETPLQIATRRRHHHVVQLLQNHDTQLNRSVRKVYRMLSSQISIFPQFCKPDSFCNSLYVLERGYVRSLYTFPYAFHPYPPGEFTEPGTDVASGYFIRLLVYLCHCNVYDRAIQDEL